MSASQTTKFQVNFKTPAGTLVNVYADTVVDGIAQMQEMLGAIPVIAEVEQAFTSGAITVPPIVNTPSFVPQAAPAPAAPAAQGHTCKHGAMVQRSGANKNTGKPWTGWFCPAPKGTPDQCEPQFVR